MTEPFASIETQATITAGMSQQAQVAAAAYLTQAMPHPDLWYDTEAITHTSEMLGRIVDAYSVNAARYADDFIADTISALTGKPFRTVGIRHTVGVGGENGVRDGVTTAGVFGRAADTYRYQQSLVDKQFIADVDRGVPSPTELATPMQMATQRVQKAAQTNLALAVRNQAAATMQAAAAKDLITGYRRVLHAELSGEGSCGLCVAASTRVYRTDHLMPMHPGCHCLPVPLAKGKDPGAAINDRDLGRFYTDAGGTSVDQLRATRYKVDEHGEIGPVLRPHDDPIRTAEQARRDTKRVRPKTPEQKVATLRNRRNSLEAAWTRAAGQTDPAWARRRAEAEARIARLDAEIVKAGG